ncbi:hypothetical protein AU468_11070 [Alkalispirochaeta sphaeroplastigenens]|uniref:Glycosyltransferase 2-like domain-containing protein n=1 Tax=Alkalispirochaeta sphaeroplastigenens TaxID=1187066 RepID=A0A2S4JHC0_9SPIO|nr:glycosyltransferase family A protein [Alkalispirochaeta sphaeroplastigenens]POQ98932.1 hypothetical protein AU468_11070 [Alkalispirochaeta sphaeroplastigenens]
MPEPTVPILMNCYSSEAFLEETLRSVWCQTYRNWRLVFVDNRSTDRSAEIVRCWDPLFCAPLDSPKMQRDFPGDGGELPGSVCCVTDRRGAPGRSGRALRAARTEPPQSRTRRVRRGTPDRLSIPAIGLEPIHPCGRQILRTALAHIPLLISISNYIPRNKLWQVRHGLFFPYISVYFRLYPVLCYSFVLQEGQRFMIFPVDLIQEEFFVRLMLSVKRTDL